METLNSVVENSLIWLEIWWFVVIQLEEEACEELISILGDQIVVPKEKNSCAEDTSIDGSADE
jgi:hypothetical protein